MTSGSRHGNDPLRSVLPGAKVGLASTEIERRLLTDNELHAIVRSQIAERLNAADGLDEHGRADAADRLRREAAVLRKYV